MCANILDLPRIKGTNPNKIHQFHEQLLYNVQSLETTGKLGDVRGKVALMIDKLAGICGDLVCNDDNWQNWDFVKLCDALGSWIRQNPVESSEDMITLLLYLEAYIGYLCPPVLTLRYFFLFLKY